MMKLTAIGALGLMASGLFAQGLNPGSQTKESWEEINFEFNSSILSDGYPSLLRLADLLAQHKDYKLKVTGNTDYRRLGSIQRQAGAVSRRVREGFSREVRGAAPSDQHCRQRQARSRSRQ